ncbi:unnamed protein product [Peronospora destructor]|uniref:Uncharacterized protein n=1 Tax=Peronospora destructor TaxID=86335 RepID=A0AAV0T4H0_9STRA|nr:unnamed protein product [Peronospora destructor]
MKSTTPQKADLSRRLLSLDSSYPAEANSTKPGVKSGSRPTSGGRPAEVEARHPDAAVKFMNIPVEGIGSTY